MTSNPATAQSERNTRPECNAQTGDFVRIDLCCLEYRSTACRVTHSTGLRSPGGEPLEERRGDAAPYSRPSAGTDTAPTRDVADDIMSWLDEQEGKKNSLARSDLRRVGSS